MSNNTCVVPTTPQVTRFTLLDGCGRPLYGPRSVFVTDSFQQVEAESEIEEGEEFTAPKANGGSCVDTKNPDRIKWDTWTWDLCRIDPEFMGSMNDTYRILYDYLGGAAGWAEGYELVSKNSIAAETWVNVAGDDVDVCDDPDSQVDGVWLWMIAPKIVNMRRGDTMTLSNEFNPIQVTGITQKGVRWGKGPHNVILNDAGQPGPLLEPLAVDDRFAAEVTTIAPPKPYCGPRPLSNPNAPAIYLTRDDTDPDHMTICVDGGDPSGGNWMADFGDGTSAQDLTPGTPVCHKYAAEGDYFVGVWDSDKPTVYRALEAQIPAHMTLSLNPTSGTAPLEVTAQVTGESGSAVLTW